MCVPTPCDAVRLQGKRKHGQLKSAKANSDGDGEEGQPQKKSHKKKGDKKADQKAAAVEEEPEKKPAKAPKPVLKV